MPDYLAPGVYVEETQSSSRPIEGVSTSTAGVIGVTERGPTDVPQIVTSLGEFRRLFGGPLPIAEFTDPATGRAHCYLPHAVEGFFVNGGKRAWVTRVVPSVATRAERMLFHEDPANPVPGDSVLLRAAQQGTGSALNQPPLYVLSAANLSAGDWVRVGDGSRTEYRQVGIIGPARHTSFVDRLAYGHPAGATAAILTLTANVLFDTLSLVDAVLPGATQITVGGADVGNFVPGAPALAAQRLLQIGTGPGREYAFAATIVTAGPNVTITLSRGLARAHDVGTAVQSPDTATASTPLTVAANAGDLLVYGPTSNATAAVLSIERGSPVEELMGVGRLAALPLDQGAYADYPAGTVGTAVTVADDTRGVSALVTARRLPLSSVAGMVPGMTLEHNPPGGDLGTIASVDVGLGIVVLSADLPSTPADGDPVLVDGSIATLVNAWPSQRVLPIAGSVAAIAPGMPVTRDPPGADTGTVGTVLAELGVVVLAADFPGVALAAGGVLRIGGSTYTLRVLATAEVVLLDDVSGLVPGQALGLGANSATIAGVDTRLGAVRLAAPLPGIPAVGDPVTLDSAHTTAAAVPGSLTLSLDGRLGLEVGDVLRIGTAPDEEYVTVARILGERGAPPDAGAVQLAHPLNGTYPTMTDVVRQELALDAAQQSANLALAAPTGTQELLASDGTGYVANDFLRLTTPDGIDYIHRLDGAAVNADPRELTLIEALDWGHGAGSPLVERDPMLRVQALDAGTWGNRLQVAAVDEPGALVPNAEVLATNPPPGPGLFSSLQLATLTGVEPGTILELLDPSGVPVAGAALLKVRGLDRVNRLVILDPPGIQAAHSAAVSAALGAGLRARVRSREWALTVELKRRPDPLVPTRNEELEDRETFRQLSMDPRHPRYVERAIGATFTPGAALDDGGNPLRRWDRRSEGASAYLRVQDLEAVIADRQLIRLGPEPLIDLLPSGLTRAARLGLFGGDDAVTLMDDALYVGTDHNEPALRTGLYALKNPQGISLVAIPGQTEPALQQALIDHCENLRYRFAVLDGPAPANDTLADVQNARALFDSRYAAFYCPWPTILDPFPQAPGNPHQYPIPPSGHLLGLYARVDNERGVHKAPANEVLRGIAGLSRYFNQHEQDILNPFPSNIDVIRDFRQNNRGIRVWGARCITSDSDYKYINVRRLMIFLEESIDRGLQWVVFEPNAPDLWARVRRSVTNFLTTVWRNGALEGETPDQGFFVRCDRTTMTQDDLDNGRLICVIGVAPVKPAEFVIIRIGLWTADAES
jgi:phage tail sheath protein FI